MSRSVCLALATDLALSVSHWLSRIAVLAYDVHDLNLNYCLRLVPPSGDTFFVTINFVGKPTLLLSLRAITHTSSNNSFTSMLHDLEVLLHLHSDS